MSFIYLASPYASNARPIQKERFQQTVDATARLIEKGVVVFSPHRSQLYVNIEVEA